MVIAEFKSNYWLTNAFVIAIKDFITAKVKFIAGQMEQTAKMMRVENCIAIRHC
jgi:hypothetical protein